MECAAVFVKGYSASVRMHVERLNVPSFCSASRTASELFRTTVPQIACYEFL